MSPCLKGSVLKIEGWEQDEESLWIYVPIYFGENILCKQVLHPEQKNIPLNRQNFTYCLRYLLTTSLSALLFYRQVT